MGVFRRKNKDGIESEKWYVDYRDPNGKRIIKAVSPKKDAEAYLGGIKKAIRDGRFFDVKKENKTTFKEPLDAYVEKVEDYARRTAEILNGLCGVILVHGNNLEILAKNEEMAEKMAKNPSLASA